MNRTLVAIVFLLIASTVVLPQDDKQAAISVVNRLFDGMKSKSAEQIKDVLAPDVHILAIDKPRDGKGL